MEGPLVEWAPPKKWKLVVFRPLYFRGTPLGPVVGPFEPGISPLMLKTDPRRPDEGPPEHVNYLFSLNFDDERLQLIIVRIENGPLGSERRLKFHPFHPVWLRYCGDANFKLTALAPYPMSGLEEFMR